MINKFSGESIFKICLRKHIFPKIQKVANPEMRTYRIFKILIYMKIESVDFESVEMCTVGQNTIF